MRVLIFFYLCNLSFELLAQHSESNFDEVVKYNRGLYRSFKAFQNNSPEITEQFVVELIDSLTQLYWYKLNSEKKIHSMIFGFSDGKDIYVQDRRGLHGYHKLDVVGKYSLYIQRTPQNSIVHRIIGSYAMIIMPNDVYKKFTIELVSKILRENDPKLSREFEAINDKKDRAIEFIEKLNSKATQ